MSRLGPTGLTQLLTNIKTWVTTKLGNYVTTDTTQTITGKKLFTNAAIQLDSLVSMSGSTMFINTSAAAPRGEFPAEAHRVGRVYIGDNTSYNGAWFIVDPTIDTNKAYYRMVTTNPDNTDSTRFSITWDSTKTGARCRKNVSMGDLLPAANNTYNLGADDLKWDIGYIHNLIGTNKDNLAEDANNYYSTTSGSHMTFYTTSNGSTTLSNVPAAVNTHLESRTIRYLSSSDWTVEQICHNTNGLYYRKGNNNGWEDWKTFAFTNSNITGTAANVTGTVAIANGGTGATTRLNAVKALTNESVGTPTHFLAITTNYAKAGYTTVAQAKTVLGITGDIVSHNASEFLTASGNETVTGTKIFNGDKIVITQGNGYRMVCNSDGGSSGYGIFQRVDSANWYLMVTAQDDALGTWTSARPASMNLSTGVLSINGNAATATQFSANTTVALTGDATGTSAGSKKGWSVPVTLANSGVTAGDYGPSEDASPAHGGTFSVPYVTVDAKGRVTAASTKTITLPSDNNTDTKVTQTVTTGNSAYPVLLCATANATATGTTTSRFSAGLTVNTRYSSIYMTNKYDTANTKGVRNTASYSNGILYFRSYDETQMGTIRCESNKGGYQQIYMMASNYIKDGAIDPEGTSTTCYITVRVRDNGSKTIYTDGSWENSLTPYADNTHSLGTASLKWKNIYANNYYKGTTAFGDIVTHNTSEFLTSHQSLSSCVKNSVTNNQTIKSTAITRGTAPSSTQTFGVVFTDNNDKYIGNVYGQYGTNKSTYVGLYAYKGTTTSNSDNESIRIGYDDSGNAYTYAPTPATSDNSTQIATTAFVKAQGYTTNTLQSIATRTSSGTWTISNVPNASLLYIRGTATHTGTNGSSYTVSVTSGAVSLIEYGTSGTVSVPSQAGGQGTITNALGWILIVNGTTGSGTTNVVIQLNNGSYNLTAYR